MVYIFTSRYEWNLPITTNAYRYSYPSMNNNFLCHHLHWIIFRDGEWVNQFSFLLASCLAVMALTNGVLKLVLLYLASCKSHAPPSITVQSGLTEGKSVPYLAQSINRFIEKRNKLFVVINIDYKKVYYCYRCKMVYDYISLKEWLCFCYHYKRVWLTWKCLIGWGRCQWSCLLLPRHYFRLGNN